MKTIVISLPSESGRRQSIREQFRKIDREFEFFDAVVGDHHAADGFADLDMNLFRLNTYRWPLLNEIACFASHRALWKHAFEANESILILEDDAKLDAGFSAALALTESLINRYGFIRLQTSIRKKRFRLTKPIYSALNASGFQLQYLSDVPLCLLAYAISPAAAEKLWLSSMTMNSPVDKFVQRTWEHGNAIYALSPSTVSSSQHSGTSSIGARFGKKLEFRLMLKRAGYKLVSELRRLCFDAGQLIQIPATVPKLSQSQRRHAKYLDVSSVRTK